MGPTRALVTHRWPCGATTYLNSCVDAGAFVNGMLEILKAAPTSALPAEEQEALAELRGRHGLETPFTLAKTLGVPAGPDSTVMPLRSERP
mmetsp:Transcript_11955/g.9621  ORF Transcript_11955/g.9621 Transcript_11955/m.9621 type:complete len:91 (+) Transcript_11955:196-468(+)